MILINLKLDCKIEKVIADKDGRYIIADILLNQVRILLVNIYAPDGQTQQVLFFKRLQQHLEPFAEVISTAPLQIRIKREDIRYVRKPL